MEVKTTSLHIIRFFEQEGREDIDIGVIILQGDCIENFLREKGFNVPLILNDEILQPLREKFSGRRGKEDYEFILKELSTPIYKPNIRVFDAFQLVMTNSPHYAELMQTILDHVSTGPQDEQDSSRTVILETQRFHIFSGQKAVLHWLSEFFQCTKDD